MEPLRILLGGTGNHCKYYKHEPLPVEQARSYGLPSAVKTYSDGLI